MSNSNADNIFKLVITERLKGNYQLAYQYLLLLLENYEKNKLDQQQNIQNRDREIYNFNIWDELGNIAFYVSKKDHGRFAFSKLIELAEKNIHETIEGLRYNGDRILKNMSFYDCPELYSKLSKILDNIKTTQDNDYKGFIKMLDNVKASTANKNFSSKNVLFEE